MKLALFRIIAVILILFGILGIFVEVYKIRTGDMENPVLGPVVSISLIVIGILILRAIATKYQVSWPLAIGVGLTFLGVAMLAMAIDGLIGEVGENIAVEFILAAIFLLAGIKLIQSGRQRTYEVQPGPKWPGERRDFVE